LCLPSNFFLRPPLYLAMASIHKMVDNCEDNPWPFLERINLGLPRDKRVVGRMSSGHLVCFKLVLQLSSTLLSHGWNLKCGRWRMLVWCTTWSVSRMLQWMMHQPYDWHGSLVEFDHQVSAEFEAFLVVHMRWCKMI
jgi:hypothetical protein